MPLDQDEQSAWRATNEVHALDQYTVRELCDYAEDRFGSEWLLYENDFKSAVDVPTLAFHWAVHHFQVDGGTVCDHFINELGRRIPTDERDWLEAQREAWLTVWEVIEVEAGESLTLQDRLSGEIRRVREASASRDLVLRDCVLARVVEHGDLTLITGMHPHLLPPHEAEWVVNRARKKLRRKRDVPIDRLRDESYGRFLIRRWEEAVEVFHAWKAQPPELHNSEGDPFLLTTDHFEIRRGAKDEVWERIRTLPDTDLFDPDDEAAGFVFLRSRKEGGKLLGSTLIGRVVRSGSSLTIETNSTKRADVLRERVEAACGERIRHRAREHADPLSETAPRTAGTDGEPAISPDEMDALALEFKQQHYENWIYEPLPALDGRTPREASRSKIGRAEVDLLLKDMENIEQRMAGDAAYDFSILRKKLGLK